jgi:two-component system, NtrC family, C4-dicarboxylate transport sensor histidine kinase DctB
VDKSSLYRDFFEEASDALLAVALPSQRILLANSAFATLMAMAGDELVGESLNILQNTIPKDFNRERHVDSELLQNPGFYTDVALQSRDGVLHLLSVKVKHIERDGQLIALAVFSDDTERQLMLRDLVAKHQSLETAYQELGQVHSTLKLTQEKMNQASKLLALGELAAGISHELNQPLTGIRGFSQEIQDILQKDKKPSRKNLLSLATEIILNSDKMASLLSQFRSFAREEKKQFKDSAEKPSEISLKQLVSSVSRLLQRQMESHGIQVSISGLQESDCLFLGRSHPVEQILINLITNSRDAILEKKHENTRLRGKVEVTAEWDKDHLWLRVSDNGSGIPESLRPRIFDPFFSTKEMGHGMGLGLSISYSLAHSLGGDLTLENTSQLGTTFVLKLPVQGLAPQSTPEGMAA